MNDSLLTHMNKFKYTLAVFFIMSSPFLWGQVNKLTHTSGVDALLAASPVVQLTLLILIALSIICWATGFYKMKKFAQIRLGNELFLEKFEKTNSLDEINNSIKDFSSSPLSRLFAAAFSELKKIAESQATHSNGSINEKLTGIDNLERVLNRQIALEVQVLESRLNWLATTGSTGPFIGLFGTVWGIMNAFEKIGQTGTASLAVVAPGISEALIATAIGLAAAIPAVALYNYLVGIISKQEVEMNNFATDFINIAKRNFFKE